MESFSLMITLILVCLSLIMLLIMAKPIKILLSIILNGLFGVGGIFIANMIMAPLGIYVGINLLTVGFIGILGLPGFFSLLLISALL